ncbi:hypothetical protein E2C01_100447 [Portunus trituberculatus]|uniref:Uncharacterized protein n=1 Tax=Portunus trituberculatus TaxID=210409 RepID=A0A5B7K316_PORTR|nr:hypothetical protein [Portunus trituberculatus]
MKNNNSNNSNNNSKAPVRPSALPCQWAKNDSPCPSCPSQQLNGSNVVREGVGKGEGKRELIRNTTKNHQSQSRSDRMHRDLTDLISLLP